MTGEVNDPDDYRIEYGSRIDRWGALVLPVLKELGPEELIARTGRKRSAAFEVMAGRSRPFGARADTYLTAAAGFANKRLREVGAEAAPDRAGTLYCYLRELSVGTVRRTCQWCGRRLPKRARARCPVLLGQVPSGPAAGSPVIRSFRPFLTPSCKAYPSHRIHHLGRAGGLLKLRSRERAGTQVL